MHRYVARVALLAWISGSPQVGVTQEAADEDHSVVFEAGAAGEGGKPFSVRRART